MKKLIKYFIFLLRIYQENHNQYKLKQKLKLQKLKYDSFSYYLYSWKIYFKQFTYEHISKFLLFAIFFASIYQKSGNGVLYLAFLLIILIIEKENRWSAAWIPICFYSISLILIQYLLQMKIFENFSLDLIKWAGFSDDPNEIFQYFALNLLILIICIIQRRSQK